MTSIPALLAAAADAHPEAVAIAAPGRPPLTYDTLAQMTMRLASALRANGVESDDTIALVVENGPAALTSFLGIAGAGACAPLNPSYRAAEFSFYLEDLGARALVVDTRLDSPARDEARRLGVEIIELDTDRQALVADQRGSGTTSFTDRPGDDRVALLLHTSGTTARPKVVPLRHGQLVASARNVAATLELTAADRCLNVMPLFHIHGIVGAALSSLVAGAGVACTPGFHPQRFFSWVDELAPTWYSAVPTMHQAILTRVREEPTLAAGVRFRCIRSSSASLPPAVGAELEAVFRAPVIEAYGMTEAAHQMASNPLPPRVRKPGSVGLPAGPEIAVLDEQGQRLPTGVVGEAAVRGPTVFAGYAANAAANATAFSDGWFRTGDEGFLDEDGYLVLRGRLKELINRGGEKISPLEVDNVLLQHPAVAEAVCFGFAHPLLGEDVGAAIVLRPGADASPEEIQEFAAGLLADFKVPRLVRVVTEIPKGSTGKLRRIGLAELLGIDATDAALAVGTYEPPRTDLERELVAMFQDVLANGPVGRNDNFFSAGGDSILAAELVTRLRLCALCAPDAPLATLVWAPTPALLGAWLEHRRDEPSPVLIPLREPSGRAPLFLVPGGNGDVVPFVGLAELLGPEHVLYAFRARALDEPVPRRLDVEDLAAEYVDAINALGPQEPIILAGICSSAPIALEMARLLQEAGREVSPLILIDPLPGAWEGQPHLAATVARSRVWARLHREMRQGRLYQLRQGHVVHTVAAAVRRRVWRRLSPVATVQTSGPSRTDVERAMDDARRRHVYRPHRGAIVVVHSRRFPTPKRLWVRLAPDGLRWIEAPVSHPTMLSVGEAPAILADALREAIRPAVPIHGVPGA